MKPTAQEIWRAEHAFASSHLDDLELGEPFIVITWCIPGRPIVNGATNNMETFEAIQKLLFELRLKKEE